MLSTLAKRPSVREGRVPWDVRWVRTKLRKLRKSEDSGAAEKAGEAPENRNSVTNTGQCPSVVPPKLRKLRKSEDSGAAEKGSPFQPELWGAGTWSTNGKVSHTINNP